MYKRAGGKWGFLVRDDTWHTSSAVACCDAYADV